MSRRADRSTSSPAAAVPRPQATDRAPGAPRRDEYFERLYAEHAAPLLAFLVYRSGDLALAEDVVADTFERVLRRRWRVDRRRGSERTGLYAIALNCLRDHQRRHRTEDRALARLSAAPERAGSAFDAADARAALARGLRTLTPEERDAISLRYGADLTIREIAAVLHLRRSTVDGRVYRALEKLRQEIAVDAPHRVL